MPLKKVPPKKQLKKLLKNKLDSLYIIAIIKLSDKEHEMNESCSILSNSASAHSMQSVCPTVSLLPLKSHSFHCSVPLYTPIPERNFTVHSCHLPMHRDPSSEGRDEGLRKIGQKQVQ
jgi:hypothetical protein